MAYISREDAAGLIPVQEVKAIFKAAEEASIVMSALTRLPDMASGTAQLKVMDALPVVYWQGSDVARKKITTAKWKDKLLVAQELAVIIPIPEAVLRDAKDSGYDIWGELRPKLVEAVAGAVDGAILLGVNKPSVWPKSLLDLAIDAGHTFAPTQGQSFYSQASNAMGLVEDDGYDVTAIIGGTSIKKYFRDMTDTTGQIIVGSEIAALPRYSVKNGAWDRTKANFMVGDFKEAVYSIRQDMEYKLLTEGVIQDPSDGSILYNLGQDDMVALRCTFRIAYQVPNPVNATNSNGETRLPFAVVLPTANKLVVALDPSAATTFTTSQKVKMSCSVATAKIYYTDDGNTPTSSSTLYEGEITVSATKTIKAIAIAEGYTNSDVVSVTYTKASS